MPQPISDVDVDVIRGVSEVRQTAVWLSDDETNWLDDRVTELKRGGWRTANRSTLIRAILQSAMLREPRLAGCRDVDDLMRRLHDGA